MRYKKKIQPCFNCLKTRWFIEVNGDYYCHTCFSKLVQEPRTLGKSGLSNLIGGFIAILVGATILEDVTRAINKK